MCWENTDTTHTKARKTIFVVCEICVTFPEFGSKSVFTRARVSRIFHQKG
jgi:hypothetical protein